MVDAVSRLPEVEMILLTRLLLVGLAILLISTTVIALQSPAFDLIFQHGAEVADECLAESVGGIGCKLLAGAAGLEEAETVGHEPAMRLGPQTDVESIDGAFLHASEGAETWVDRGDFESGRNGVGGGREAGTRGVAGHVAEKIQSLRAIGAAAGDAEDAIHVAFAIVRLAVGIAPVNRIIRIG